jgi:hypothetical protein
LKTPQAARELGVSYWKLCALLRSDKIPFPAKDTSGDYVWSAADLERARAAMQVDRRRKEARSAS